MADYGVAAEANAVFTAVTTGVDFPIPTIDPDDPLYKLPSGTDSELYKVVTKLTNKDLSTGVVDGTGTFDVLMTGFAAHLSKEYKENRISGAEYTKAFIALTDSAMSGAVQYLLGRDQAFWAAQAAQIAAITGQVQLRLAFAELAKMQFEANTAKANFALTKAKLATEDASYGLAKAQEVSQTQLLPLQKALLIAQELVAREQLEINRAQTMNTRTDNTTVVTGVLGKQKDLYAQQITSYQRDGEVKAAKMFIDAWVTQKTMDEGLVAPSSLQNSSVDTVMNKIKVNNALT